MNLDIRNYLGRVVQLRNIVLGHYVGNSIADLMKDGAQGMKPQ